MFNEEDKIAFLSALNTGLGLTAACDLLLMDPKQVSEHIVANQDLHKECIDALKFSAKALLVISNTHLNDEQYEKWKSNNSHIREFIPNLVLWESYKQKKDVVPVDITVAIHVYKTLAELATAIGFTRRELLEYITSNEQLSIYLTEKSFL